MKPDLNALTEEWSEILENRDTLKSVTYERKFNMEEDEQGSCLFTIERGRAIIKLLDPGDEDPACAFPYDVEQTLVHELLHIPFEYFCPEDRESLEFKKWEQELDRLARVLVKLKRMAVCS